MTTYLSLPSIATVTEQFHAAMISAGLTCAEAIIADGKLHRFHVTNDELGSQNGWYVLYDHPVPAGAFGCWKRSISETWRLPNSDMFSVTEKTQVTQLLQEAKAKRDAEQANIQLAAKNKAQKIWQEAIPEDNQHTYLIRKKVAAYGIRQLDGKLIIPLYNTEQEIHTLQFISPQGKKSFLSGGAKKSHFFVIGTMVESDQPTDKIYLCEGYATGATIHAVTLAPVVIAFDAGNLLSVAEVLKQNYAHSEIIICADNDQWTEENIGVQKAQEAAGAIQAKICIPDFNSGMDVSSKPTDFNDLLQLCGLDEVKRQLEQNTQAVMCLPQCAETKSILPAHYFLTDKGLFYFKEEEHSKSGPTKALWLSSPLSVIAYFRNVQNEGFGLVLEFKDWDHIVHQYLMPFSLLEKEESEYRSILVDKGLRISSHSRAQKLLKSFLKEIKPQVPARLVYRTGWHEQMFALPHTIYGASKQQERLLLQRENIQTPYQISGTLEDWQQHVSIPCIGNSRLIFAISCAFAAPLLYITGDENGGFHFRGSSSTGKTTALLVAASVWGGKAFLQRWRATTNGLEALAALHHDSLLCLDELAQVDPKEAGEIIYMLANGSGKQRANRMGHARDKTNWRLLFLSSGEISLNDQLTQIGKNSRAGQEVRMVNIEADAGAGLGLFETIHQEENPSVFAETLKKSLSQYYGSAADHYLQALTKIDSAMLARNILAWRKDIMDQILPNKCHGQVLRVAHRFALVAAAGELATELKITGWTCGEATQAVQNCFQSWLAERGGTEAYEINAALEQVRHFFELHGDARFVHLNYPNTSEPLIRDRVGFKREGHFFVLPEVFKKDICKGLDWRTTSHLLVEHGWLLPDSGGKFTQVFRLPDGGRIRCYRLTQKMFEAA